MDSMEFPAGRSPRRELQGPRPTPLKISKDSHKISKKPPMAPHPPLQQPQIRPPVIIYTLSPKVIHTNPRDFMNLVQRLTGLESSSSSSSSSSLSSSMSFGPSFPRAAPMADINNSAAISPAARYATIERAARVNPDRKNINQSSYSSVDRELRFVEEIELDRGVERPGFFPGILSPGPTSLSPIPMSFFSPVTADPSSLSFFHDLSPILHESRSFLEGNPFMPSPSNFVSPSHPSIDLFNNFSDY